MGGGRGLHRPPPELRPHRKGVFLPRLARNWLQRSAFQHHLPISLYSVDTIAYLAVVKPVGKHVHRLLEIISRVHAVCANTPTA